MKDEGEEEVPDFKLDGKLLNYSYYLDPDADNLMTPDERDELDAEILNEIKNYQLIKKPYIEDVKVANCNKLCK